jgi:hypothetical protein
MVDVAIKWLARARAGLGHELGSEAPRYASPPPSREVGRAAHVIKLVQKPTNREPRARTASSIAHLQRARPPLSRRAGAISEKPSVDEKVNFALRAFGGALRSVGTLDPQLCREVLLLDEAA